MHISQQSLTIKPLSNTLHPASTYPNGQTSTHVPKSSPQKQLQTASTRLSIVQRAGRGQSSDSLLPASRLWFQGYACPAGHPGLRLCGKSVKTDSLEARRLGRTPWPFPCDADRGRRRRRHHCLIYLRVEIHHWCIQAMSCLVYGSWDESNSLSRELSACYLLQRSLACPQPLRVPKSMVRRSAESERVGRVCARATAARLRYLNLTSMSRIFEPLRTGAGAGPLVVLPESTVQRVSLFQLARLSSSEIFVIMHYFTTES